MQCYPFIGVDTGEIEPGLTTSSTETGGGDITITTEASNRTPGETDTPLPSRGEEGEGGGNSLLVAGIVMSIAALLVLGAVGAVAALVVFRRRQRSRSGDYQLRETGVW